MATRDGLAQIWYADANGVVTGYTPNVDNVASAIIDAYNEHFGTNIGIWTPETISLQVGDTVPNWDGYEKIDLVYKFATSLTDGTSNFIFGNVKGGLCKIVANQDKNMYFSNANGVIMSEMAGSYENVGFQTLLTQRFRNAGITITSISGLIEALEVGQQIEEWETYNKIS